MKGLNTYESRCSMSDISRAVLESEGFIFPILLKSDNILHMWVKKYMHASWSEKQNIFPL